jgi:hypothetical protein
MALKDILGLVTGGASSLLSGALPYVLIGSLIAGTAGGFYAGSVWYGNKYKGQLDSAHAETALVQQRYDGFKNGALIQAGKQNDFINQLEDHNRKLTADLLDEQAKKRLDEEKKSSDLKKGLQNAKDGQPLSDSAIDYFKRLSGQH